MPDLRGTQRRSTQYPLSDSSIRDTDTYPEMCVNTLLWKSNPSPERKIPVGGSDAEDVTEECGTWKKGQYLNKLKCSNFIYMLSSVQLLGRVRLFATP